MCQTIDAYLGSNTHQIKTSERTFKLQPPCHNVNTNHPNNGFSIPVQLLKVYPWRRYILILMPLITVFLSQVEKYDLALKNYMKIAAFLVEENTLEGEKLEEKNALLLAGYLNSAACQLKMNVFIEAQKSCDKALSIDSNNVKGYFRRGQVCAFSYLCLEPSTGSF